MTSWDGWADCWASGTWADLLDVNGQAIATDTTLYSAAAGDAIIYQATAADALIYQATAEDTL